MMWFVVRQGNVNCSKQSKTRKDEGTACGSQNGGRGSIGRPESRVCMLCSAESSHTDLDVGWE
jgi:hypothetical protein